MIELTLPWPPSALSPNKRLHWSTLAKAKKAYRHACGYTALQQGARPLKAKKLHAAFVFYPPTRARIDLDNLIARMKSGIDGVADVLRVDDSNWSMEFDKSTDIGGMVKVRITER